MSAATAALMAYGRVTSVRDVKSLGVTRVTIELPLECHVQATSGFYDQTVALTRVELPPGTPYGISPVAAPAEPVAPTQKARKQTGEGDHAPASDKPFGAAASLLYKPQGGGMAFLAIPRVQQAVGLTEQVSDLSLVSATLAEQLGHQSLGYVDPARVVEWATEQGVAVFLPRLYKQCQSALAA
jgi:hypothetical protein